MVNFKGREVEFRDIGYQLLDKFTKDLGEVRGTRDSGIHFSSSNFTSFSR